MLVRSPAPRLAVCSDVVHVLQGSPRLRLLARRHLRGERERGSALEPQRHERERQGEPRQHGGARIAAPSAADGPSPRGISRWSARCSRAAAPLREVAGRAGWWTVNGSAPCHISNSARRELLPRLAEALSRSRAGGSRVSSARWQSIAAERRPRRARWKAPNALVGRRAAARGRGSGAFAPGAGAAAAGAAAHGGTASAPSGECHHRASSSFTFTAIAHG